MASPTRSVTVGSERSPSQSAVTGAGPGAAPAGSPDSSAETAAHEAGIATGASASSGPTLTQDASASALVARAELTTRLAPQVLSALLIDGPPFP